MEITIHEAGFRIETYSFDDFINYNPYGPQKQTAWFWLSSGKTEHIDKEGEGWDTIFPKEDYEKAQPVLYNIYNNKVSELFELIKTNFIKRWQQSEDKDRLILLEINDFEKLLFEEKLDLTKITNDSTWCFELRLPNNKRIRRRRSPQYEEIPPENITCVYFFYVNDIRSIRRIYKDIIVNGEKDYSKTAPNNQHLYDDAPLIEVEAYYKFYNWLKDFEGDDIEIKESIPELIVCGANSPQSLDDLFKDPKMIDPAISILKKIKPALINEENEYLGKNLTAFKLWFNFLQEHGIVKSTYVNNETLGRLFKLKFPGFKITPDGSSLKIIGKKANDFYYEKFEVEVSELSKKSKLSK